MLSFKNISPVIVVLGLLGSLPFLIVSVVVNYSVISAGNAASSQILGIYAPSIFVNYSAIILAFLSGALWGSRDNIRNSKEQTSLLVFTNLMAISAWLLLIASHPIKLIAIDFCAFVGSSVFCYLSHRSFLYDHSFRLQSFEASVDFDCGHQSL